MNRYKAFNPADYYMVGGKILPKYQNAGTQTGDDQYFVKDLSGGKKQYKIENIDGKGTNLIFIKDSSGKIVESINYKLDASGAPIKDDTYVRRIYKDNFSQVYTGSGNTYKGIGPGYAGYDWRKADWKGNEYQQNAQKYQDLLTKPENQDMVDAMYQRYKDKAAYNNMPVLSRDEFVNILIKGQKDNALMHSVYGEDVVSGEYWDKPNTFASSRGLPAFKNQNQAYENAARELGFDAMTPEQSRQFQAAYNASFEIANIPEFINRFKAAGFQADPQGVKQPGEPGYLSGVEGKYGNTTNQYYWRLGEPAPVKPEDPAAPAAPGKKYYCVEDDSGKRVVAVNEGEAAPAGATSTGYSNSADAEKICNLEDVEPAPPQLPAPDTWFGNDVRNYITALGQRIYKGRPQLFQSPRSGFGYALESPDSLIASTTGMSNAYNNLLANTMSGPAAAAASLGAQGTFLEKLGQDIAGVNTRNQARLTDAYGKRAQADYLVDTNNLNARAKYAMENAIFGQSLYNSLNKRDALQTEFLNKGEENRFDDEMLRVMYPQASYPNRLNMGRTWDWSGRGRNPFEPDLYSSPSSSSNDLQYTQQGGIDAYTDAYDAAIERGYEPEQAQEIASNAQKNYYTQAAARAKNATNYASARYSKNRGYEDGGSYGASYFMPWEF